MKKYILYSAFQLLFFSVIAQKHDKYMVFGDIWAGNFAWGIDSTESKLIENKKPGSASMWLTNSTMSDGKGELIFYSNGVSISNRQLQIMENGSRINPSPSMELNFYTEDGLPVDQGAISIPVPGSDSLYYLIYSESERVILPNNKSWYISPHTFYAKIDISKNNGLGSVIEKDIPITSDTTNEGNLIVCKHANGRDWWLVLNKVTSRNYMIYLIDKNGFHYKGRFDSPIGDKFDNPGSYCQFTPDGKKMFYFFAPRLYQPIFFDIFDFDRCSGTLSSPKRFQILDSLKYFAFSTCISPNSRYLYFAHSRTILQYDLEAKDIVASVDTVAVYDGFKTSDGYATRFYQQQLGADGKIYISTSSASTYLHVIQEPDKKGKNCNVKQHIFDLKYENAFSMPNFPNYRLGPLKGSPCDTIVAIHEITKEDYHIKVFPNPATTELKIDITIPQYDAQITTEIRLVSATGAIVKTYTMPDFAYLATLDISAIESGFYEVQLRQRGKTMAVEKVVVIR